MPAETIEFTNPLLDFGPDPWTLCHDGFYYYTHSTRTDLSIWKTDDITQLGRAEYKVVWQPPKDGPHSKHIWAPELHYLDDGEGHKCWYAYFSADDGDKANQRIWVLENPDCDPIQGEWTVKNQLVVPDDTWAIDGTVIDLDGQLYLSWSGWETPDENQQQNIYLCRMSNPWTCVGERLRLSAPELPWERHNDDPDPESPRSKTLVNEGPAFVRHGEYLFIAYSASGCWTDEYAVGLLTARIDSDLMDPASWTKSPEPVFKKSAQNSVYGPGHVCFFHTDAGQTWMIYHANPGPNKGCEDERTPRLQPIHWHRDGSPNFGVPAATDRAMQF